jgi:hypothetical protein
VRRIIAAAAGPYRPNSNVQLEAEKEICDVWPEQPNKKHLHVFVSRHGMVTPTIVQGVDDGGECLFAPAQNI